MNKISAFLLLSMIIFSFDVSSKKLKRAQKFSLNLAGDAQLGQELNVEGHRVAQQLADLWTNSVSDAEDCDSESACRNYIEEYTRTFNELANKIAPELTDFRNKLQEAANNSDGLVELYYPSGRITVGDAVSLAAHFEAGKRFELRLPKNENKYCLANICDDGDFFGNFFD